MTHRGYFAAAVYQPKHEANVGTLWRSAVAYGAAFLATVGCRYERQASDTCKSPVHTPLLHYRDLDDLVAHLPWSCPLVAVELTDTATPLDEFEHPLRALYLFGAEGRGLPADVLDRCHRILQIPSAVPWSLNVSAAATVVLYDRHVKMSKTGIDVR